MMSVRWSRFEVLVGAFAAGGITPYAIAYIARGYMLWGAIGLALSALMMLCCACRLEKLWGSS